jgi:hypothetical protein
MVAAVAALGLGLATDNLGLGFLTALSIMFTQAFERRGL